MICTFNIVSFWYLTNISKFFLLILGEFEKEEMLNNGWNVMVSLFAFIQILVDFLIITVHIPLFLVCFSLFLYVCLWRFRIMNNVDLVTLFLLCLKFETLLLLLPCKLICWYVYHSTQWAVICPSYCRYLHHWYLFQWVLQHWYQYYSIRRHSLEIEYIILYFVKT